MHGSGRVHATGVQSDGLAALLVCCVRGWSRVLVFVCAHHCSAMLLVSLQNAQRTGLWRGVVKGALKAVQTASFGGYRAGLEAGGSCNEESRQRAALALPLLNSVDLLTRTASCQEPLPKPNPCSSN